MLQDDAQGSHFLGTVLVTGGTGTFGHAFTKHVLSNDLAERIKILSRDEKKQADMEALFDDSRLRFYLGDVRDRERMEWALQGVDVVIAAAAMKRIERSALDVWAFVEVNVWGVYNTLMAAHKCGVKKAVVLSSDKACSSISPYGTTKALAEWLAINLNVMGPCRSLATRYGNVEGSRGSVLETWQRQYENGAPLQVTHPDMTRFWMTADEAVDLVLLALRKGRGGEVFLPRELRRGKIVDLINQRFPGAEIEIIGKRSYEKMAEEMVSPEEMDRLVDVGEALVLLPHPRLVRWQPLPYGMGKGEGNPMPMDFQYRSDS